MRTRLIAVTLGSTLTAGMLVLAPTALAVDGGVSIGTPDSVTPAVPPRTSPGAPAAPATAAAAAVAVTIGQTGTPFPCDPGNTTWTQQAVGGPPGYTVPGAGVITAYSHNANATVGSIRAVILGPAAAPNDRTVLSFSPLAAITPSVLNTFPVRLPVPANASLGIYFTTSQTGCGASSPDPGDVMSGSVLDPSVSSTYTPLAAFPSFRLNLSAVWEPDVDNDGFGDVSQDACPQSALAQSPCPAPETTVTKKPAKKSFKRKAKIKFTSSPGATFTCAVDGKSAKPCTSPFKKRFRYGKHVVVITATSSAGIVDPTPARVEFKIKRPS